MEENNNEAESGWRTKKNLIIIIAIVILLGIGITLQVLRSGNDGETENTNTSEEVDTNTNAATETNTNTVVPSDNPMAKSRDAKRVNDIKVIMAALENFNVTNGGYPPGLNEEGLGELVTGGQLGSVPQNPTPGGISYRYTPIGSAPHQSYDLCYTLESSAIENIEAGNHCATPAGIVAFF